MFGVIVPIHIADIERGFVDGGFNGHEVKASKRERMRLYALHSAPQPFRHMQIWVDADACPGVIKEILFRVAERRQLPVVLVANILLRHPPSPWIRAVQVPKGFDVADNHIVEAVAVGDLVITADIPLAAAVIDKRAHALNPRGELYSKENIREILDMRNFMDTLRSSGVETGGPNSFNTSDRQNFANQLDRLLAKRGARN